MRTSLLIAALRKLCRETNTTEVASALDVTARSVAYWLAGTVQPRAKVRKRIEALARKRGAV